MAEQGRRLPLVSQDPESWPLSTQDSSPCPQGQDIALLSPVPTAEGGLGSGEGSPRGGTTGRFEVPILETPLTGWMVSTTEASVAGELASLETASRPPVEDRGGGQGMDQETLEVFLRHHITSFPLCSSFKGSPEPGPGGVSLAASCPCSVSR